MTNPNYKNSRKLASEILILQDSLTFPIDVEKITLDGKKIIFSSYKNYAKKKGINVSDLSCNGEFKDAMIINHTNETKIILYNSDITSKGRILWNKAHELGHIVLKHRKQGETEEIEANTFASQLLLPQCLLKELLRNNLSVTTDYIITKFGLSKAAAESCMKLVGKKLDNSYDAYYDDIIIFKCSDFIKNETKNNIRSSYYDDTIEDERNNWLYDL